MYAKTEPNIAVFTCGKSDERVKLGFHFIGPLTTRDGALYGKKDREIKISTLKDIKKQGLVVGAMREDWRSKYLQEKGVIVEPVNVTTQNINKLIFDRIDLWVSSDLEITTFIQDSFKYKFQL